MVSSVLIVHQQMYRPSFSNKNIDIKFNGTLLWNNLHQAGRLSPKKKKNKIGDNS